MRYDSQDYEGRVRGEVFQDTLNVHLQYPVVSVRNPIMAHTK